MTAPLSSLPASQAVLLNRFCCRICCSLLPPFGCAGACSCLEWSGFLSLQNGNFWITAPPASPRLHTSSPLTTPSLNDALQAFVSVAEGKVLSTPSRLALLRRRSGAGTGGIPDAPGAPLGIYRVEPEALARTASTPPSKGKSTPPRWTPPPSPCPSHTPAERNQAQFCARMDNLCRWLSLGVETLDMNAVYIDIDVEIGSGTLLLPGTILRGRTVIGENCEIGPNTMIPGTVCWVTAVSPTPVSSTRPGSAMHVNIGPFAYVRPGSVVEDGCKVGGFSGAEELHPGRGAPSCLT